MDNKNIFARNLERQMKLAGKSRRDLSEALGVSYYTITDWVKGKKYPRMDKVEMLARYFGIQKSDLIEEITKEKPIENDGLTKSQRDLIEFAKGLSEDEAAQLLQTVKLLVQGMRK